MSEQCGLHLDEGSVGQWGLELPILMFNKRRETQRLLALVGH